MSDEISLDRSDSCTNTSSRTISTPRTPRSPCAPKPQSVQYEAHTPEPTQGDDLFGTVVAYEAFQALEDEINWRKRKYGESRADEWPPGATPPEIRQDYIDAEEEHKRMLEKIETSEDESVGDPDEAQDQVFKEVWHSAPERGRSSCFALISESRTRGSQQEGQENKASKRRSDETETSGGGAMRKVDNVQIRKVLGRRRSLPCLKLDDGQGLGTGRKRRRCNSQPLSLPYDDSPYAPTPYTKKRRRQTRRQEHGMNLSATDPTQKEPDSSSPRHHCGCIVYTDEKSLVGYPDESKTDLGSSTSRRNKGRKRRRLAEDIEAG